MFIVRPVALNDLDALYKMSSLAKVGLTTLPHDRAILESRIQKSLGSFKKKSRCSDGELYFFVLEDTKTKKVVGTSSVISKVGGFEPFYTYKIETAIKESKLLGVRKEIRYLRLVKNHSGPSEIGTLFLIPKLRSSGVGRPLSLTRFLFMAEHPESFEKQVIAELRGVIDENGRSPFWDSLGVHFFEVELKKADFLGMADKSFIAELMPEHPIYLPLLPKKAQAVIGKVHEDTKPALHLLKREGFEFIGEIDIFEAGPVMGCPLRSIRTVRESRIARVEKIINQPENASEHSCVIANIQSFEKFRAAAGSLKLLRSGAAQISSELAQGLGISKGDLIRYAPLACHSEASVSKLRRRI